MKLEAARAWAARRWRWLAAGAAVLLVVGWVNRQRVLDEWARRTAASAEERGAARAADVPVAEPVAPAAIAKKAAELEKQNAQLRAELARARKAVPGARPVAVLSASTAPAPAAGAVAAGEKLRLEIEQVDLRGKGGARLLVGTVAARREDGELLLREPFQTPLAVALEEAPPAPEVSRWGVGGVAVLGGKGWSGGAARAVPTMRLPLVRWKVDAQAGVAFGHDGTKLVGAVVVRP